MYRLISQKNQKEYLIKDTEKDFSFDIGFLTKKDIVSDKILIKIKGIEYLKIPLNEFDKFNKLKISAQVITLKDIGYVLSRTLLDKNSLVLEAGSGSLRSGIVFSNFVKHLKTYEINENRFCECSKIIKDRKIENIELINKDLLSNLKNEENKNYDLIFLDMVNSQNILDSDLLSTLKKGKYICFYLTSIIQVIDLFKKIDNEKYLFEEVCEITKRDWIFKDKTSRPQNRKEIDFTAFLVFVRKLF